MSRVEIGTGRTGKSEASRNQRELSAEQKGGIALGLQQHQPAQVKLAPIGFLERRLPGEPADLKERWR